MILQIIFDFLHIWKIFHIHFHYKIKTLHFIFIKISQINKIFIKLIKRLLDINNNRIAF